jgi:hypothetical protein
MRARFPSCCRAGLENQVWAWPATNSTRKQRLPAERTRKTGASRGCTRGRGQRRAVLTLRPRATGRARRWRLATTRACPACLARARHGKCPDPAAPRCNGGTPALADEARAVGGAHGQAPHALLQARVGDRRRVVGEAGWRRGGRCATAGRPLQAQPGARRRALVARSFCTRPCRHGVQAALLRQSRARLEQGFQATLDAVSAHDPAAVSSVVAWARGDPQASLSSVRHARITHRRRCGARRHCTRATPEPASLTAKAALKLPSRVAAGAARSPIAGGTESTTKAAATGGAALPTRSVPTTVNT